jgi:prepilin-type N-terminal cleavage/methylation domain-containing protein
MRRRAGFTLVELLLAVAIMLTVLVFAGTAYQLYTRTWAKDLSRIDQTFAEFRHTALFVEACRAIIPLSVRKSMTEKQSWGFYFLGREEGFTAVTASPVYATGYPAVIRVFREFTEDGGQRLVYEEASMRGLVLNYADQTLDFKFRQVILHSRDPIVFAYYGWESLDAKMNSSSEFMAAGQIAEPRWFTDYDGIARGYQPDQIRVQIGTSMIQLQLPNRTVLGLKRTDPDESI